MKTFTFIGCSLTQGIGLSKEENDENNYANIVGTHFNAKIKNLSKLGNSNYNIFLTALNEILYDKPDAIFLQWSGLQRHWLYPNLDLVFPIINKPPKKDLCYLNTKFTKEFLKKFTDQFLILNHDYHNILQLLNYCRILETITNDQVEIVFINGILPWTKEILYSHSVKDPAKYFSSYTKDLLSTDLLPDQDIELFFNKLYEGIQQLNQNKWVNMFESIVSLAEDFGTDNLHPGIKSHKKIANIIIDKLTHDKRL
jgi:hypothetical protein